MSERKDNVVDLAAAYDKAKKHVRKGKRGGEPPEPPREPPDDGGAVWPPSRLPWNSPVQALGVDGRNFYFLNVRGQFLAMADKDLGRLAILGMFGGNEYLRTTWPKFDRSNKFVVNFDHGAIGEVLIASCTDKGIWSPEENVRGVGTWAEEGEHGSQLVMHCGDALYLSGAMAPVAPGLRGRLLYPAAPAQPHPEVGPAGERGPAGVLLAKLRTWNWARGEADAMMTLGDIMACILGAAPEWRPIAWFTGGSGTGKSTLMKLIRWTMGERAMIRSEDATPAGIKHRVGNTALPVSLDELESEGKGNDRVQAVVKLMRIASSGGESLRGSPSGQAMSFISRNAFQASSIVITSLPQQDKNRMFIGTLGAVEWEGARGEPGSDLNAEDGGEEEDGGDLDSVLGARAEWERIGRQLRGRALAQWPRYKKTFRAYRKALEKAGHNARGADQFGALGAAYDIAMYDELDLVRVEAWGAMLPAASLAETSGYSATHESCLAHMLGAPIEAWKGGVKESVARMLKTAREEMFENSKNDRGAASALLMHGLKVFRDKRDESGQAWWVAVSHTHSGLARIFANTDWAGIPGAPGAWAQMMGRLPGTQENNRKGNRLKLRFDGPGQYCTLVPWETVFPPKHAGDDDDELVKESDQ